MNLMILYYSVVLFCVILYYLYYLYYSVLFCIILVQFDVQ